MTNFTIDDWRTLSKDDRLDLMARVVMELHVVEDALRLLAPNYPTVARKNQGVVASSRTLIACLIEEIHPLPSDIPPSTERRQGLSDRRAQSQQQA